MVTNHVQYMKCYVQQLLPILVVCPTKCNNMNAIEERLCESMHRYPHKNDYLVSPLSVMDGFECGYLKRFKQFVFKQH